MILEGIVTTVSSKGQLNIAPMGPRICADSGLRQFELRPFRTSNTFRNLESQGEGVFHITDDVLLLAQAAIGSDFDPPPAIRPATTVGGWILTDSCRYYEFRVVGMDDSDQRASIHVETVAEGKHRDFLGFNRARNAVIEAAILATRTSLIPRDQILADLDKFAVIIAKTGGPNEDRALRILRRHVLESSPPQETAPPS